MRGNAQIENEQKSVRLWCAAHLSKMLSEECAAKRGRSRASVCT